MFKCVGTVVVCKAGTCSRYSVLSAAVPGAKCQEMRAAARQGIAEPRGTARRFAINICKVPHICCTTFHTNWESSNT